MKKIIAFLFAFVMIFSAVSSLADPDYLGAWVSICEPEKGDTSIVVFRLLPDHSVFYASQSFSAAGMTPGLSGVFAWEEIEEGSFRILDDQDAVIGEYYQINKNRLLGSNDIMFSSVMTAPPMNQIAFESTPEPTETPEPESTGLTVPAGVYIAGEDFPAGTYRIELADQKSGSVVVLYEKMEDTTRAFAYLHEYTMNKRSPVIGKMVIEDGNVLDIRSGVIILLPYEGLK